MNNYILTIQKLREEIQIEINQLLIAIDLYRHEIAEHERYQQIEYKEEAEYHIIILEKKISDLEDKLKIPISTLISCPAFPRGKEIILEVNKHARKKSTRLYIDNQCIQHFKCLVFPRNYSFQDDRQSKYAKYFLDINAQFLNCEYYRIKSTANTMYFYLKS